MPVIQVEILEMRRPFFYTYPMCMLFYYLLIQRIDGNRTICSFFCFKEEHFFLIVHLHTPSKIIPVASCFM